MGTTKSTKVNKRSQRLFGIKSTDRKAETRNQHHKKGANYGWPVVTYGIDYDGTTMKPKSQELKTHLLLGSSLLLGMTLCNK
jgi:glucose/arabinose dehydrogenase